MSQSPHAPDYRAWLGRSEILHDTASLTAAVGLGALLDTPIETEAGTAKLFPLGHWLQFTPTTPTGKLGADGHPKLGGFMPPLTLPRRMWAGSKIAYHFPIHVGQSLERVTTIESITPRTGSTGELCFVVLRHDISAEGAAAITEHQTLVYREAPGISEPAGLPAHPPSEHPPPPEGWDWVHQLRPSEIMLFRYSALTFNSHRIHYDLPYATKVEGYQGLVVHGPLSATLLLDGFLKEYPGAEIANFEFSARSPILAGEQIYLAGRASEENHQQLAAIGLSGKPSVIAELTTR